ncbi:centrosomal protein of 19 kDa [Hippoglossus hippoglossus]|uniref:centrosomal protein of 19 kDa n=1 Tax=Hippoglossus hippoglossus TaxID=8267 RepID=UPI00148D3C57|nr:centrosomal protein of 19 kDa [Hippoglossus hippoglossus]XP_035031855.1 centrosomal protein of 19 kDa [Hippoglossus stenolepis]
MLYEAKQCGVKFSPASVVLIYQHTETKKIRKRIIPLRNFSQYSDCSLAAERLKNNLRHRDYLEAVSQGQLEKLHIILRDHMQGYSLEHSLASFQLDPDQDLNKLDDEELARKKGQMDELFEKNRRRKDDADFVYDVEVEFSKSTREKCSWDEESDEF